jgi:3-oxoacyl-[acyl-carrier-protein] synthase-3
MLTSFKFTSISQIIAAVPATTVQNINLDFDDKTKKKIIKMTGVHERHILSENQSLEELYGELGNKLFETIERDSIDAIIVVSQTPEYRLPTTANLLHGKFNLKKEALAFDINQGCSGYIYGLFTVMSLIEANPCLSRVLLFAGEATSKIVYSGNKSTAFLFGDAATLTLCERNENTSPSHFLLRSDGKGSHNLIVRDGGIAHPFSITSMEPKTDAEGNINIDTCLYMNGAEVFNFTTEEVPPLINDLVQYAQIPQKEIDVFCLHQANKFMLEYLADKMEISDRTPINIEKYGNTSSASIPLLICDLPNQCLKPKTLIAGFGVGYSMGAALINLSSTKTDFIEVP